MNEILNHFGAVEVLLRRRRKVLESFDGCGRTDAIFVENNRLFNKAIIDEMRKLVEAYDRESNDGGKKHE